MSEVINVWAVKAADYTRTNCVHSSVEDALGQVRGLFEELCDGQEVTIIIAKRQMVQSEYDALEEFEGY